MSLWIYVMFVIDGTGKCLALFPFLKKLTAKLLKRSPQLWEMIFLFQVLQVSSPCTHVLHVSMQLFHSYYKYFFIVTHFNFKSLKVTIFNGDIIVQRVVLSL